MKNLKLKQITQNLFHIAGIKINGKKPHDIIVHDDRLYQRILSQGSLGLGESYIDGEWDCKALDEFFYKILMANLDEKVAKKSIILASLKARLINLQSKSRAHKVVKTHYDLGNNLYENMLDKRMVYTCGYWKNAKTLDQAQEAKLDLICKKIGLKPGMKVLDIGCGFGSFAKYAAEKYKVKVVGITISKEQLALGKKLCKGLPVKLRFQDYRNLNEKFDCIVSIGMFEAVGPKNYKTYMKIVNKCLKPNGLFLLHTIGNNISTKLVDRWINKYIFPNGVIPSPTQITQASEGLFVIEDWHNFGTDYDKTLIAWHKNFKKNWNKIKKDYDMRFKRMWEYYLLACAGSFRARKTQLWQIVFSKEGYKGRYKSIR